MGLRQGKSLFDIAREREKQRSKAQLQERQDALKRRFAAIGGLGSGAAIKQEQIAQQKAEESLRGRLTDIDIAQSERERQEREVEKQRQFAAEQNKLGREFARQERLGGQEFAQQQTEEQRRFATAERIDSQVFAQEQFKAKLRAERQEAQRNRDFARAERISKELFQIEVNEKAQKFASEEAQKARDATISQNEKALKLKTDIFEWQKTASSREYDLAMEQFEIDKVTTDFNMRLAAAQAIKEGLPGAELLTGQGNPALDTQFLTALAATTAGQQISSGELQVPGLEEALKNLNFGTNLNIGVG